MKTFMQLFLGILLAIALSAFVICNVFPGDTRLTIKVEPAQPSRLLCAIRPFIQARLPDAEIAKHFKIEGAGGYGWDRSSRCSNCNTLSPPHTPYCWVPDSAQIGDSLQAIRGTVDRTPYRMGQFVNVATSYGSGWCLDCASKLILSARDYQPNP